MVNFGLELPRGDAEYAPVVGLIECLVPMSWFDGLAQAARDRTPSRFLSLPLSPLEEMPSGLLSGILIGHHDAPHFVVTLEHPHHALEEGLGERVVDHIGGVVPHHFHHILVKDFTVDPFEA
jgi:hypothetical protein